jgi:hypothetical protein
LGQGYRPASRLCELDEQRVPITFKDHEKLSYDGIGYRIAVSVFFSLFAITIAILPNRV